jgi:hypothetical protein
MYSPSIFFQMEVRGQIHSPAILSHGIGGWLGPIPRLLTLVAEKRIVSLQEVGHGYQVCNQPVWLSYSGLRQDGVIFPRLRHSTLVFCWVRLFSAMQVERTNERMIEWMNQWMVVWTVIGDKRRKAESKWRIRNKRNDSKKEINEVIGVYIYINNK